MPIRHEVVGNSLSFPTPPRTPQSDIGVKSYERKRGTRGLLANGHEVGANGHEVGAAGARGRRWNTFLGTFLGTQLGP